jgi:hypothetical protein
LKLARLAMCVVAAMNGIASHFDAYGDSENIGFAKL